MLFKDHRWNETISSEEERLVNEILFLTKKYNADNISRTEAYFSFYNRHPEITWSFLASMVSRNAGWNMCDLEGEWFTKIIEKQSRDELFLTYERANWLIFQDAFPQLLLYHYSTKMKQPMFHLLRNFYVSNFMEREWACFWKEKQKNQLMIAQIINEQNVIQQPVIQHPFYKNKVFKSPLFFFQDWLHFSSVLFPTCEGELYGASVNGFKSVTKRIDLGKRLANILFDKNLYPLFYEFSSRTVHTGSRHDYEQYFKNPPKRSTPFLRCTFPYISHQRRDMKDWSRKSSIPKKWTQKSIKHVHSVKLTDWYADKQKQIKKCAYLMEFLRL